MNNTEVIYSLGILHGGRHFTARYFPTDRVELASGAKIAASSVLIGATLSARGWDGPQTMTVETISISRERVRS